MGQAVKNCPFSYLILRLPDIPDPGIRVFNDTENKEVTVSVVALSKEMLALGSHLIAIEERDIFTEKVAVRQYALTV